MKIVIAILHRKIYYIEKHDNLIKKEVHAYDLHDWRYAFF